MRARSFSRLSVTTAIFATLCVLAGCKGVETQSGASYPDRPEGTDKILYSDQKRDTVWGEGTTLGDRLFRDKTNDSSGDGLAVNSYLWRASLDTISFMPIASVDAFGGVILTEWYENPDAPGERFKMNITILDKQLRADGVRVAVFKQQQDKGQWRDVKVDPKMATDIENTILTRARELRVAQMGTGKN